jgi:hypothetical protein
VVARRQARQEGVGCDEEEEGIGRSLRIGLKESLSTKEIAEDSQSCVARRDSVRKPGNKTGTSDFCLNLHLLVSIKIIKTGVRMDTRLRSGRDRPL